MISTLIFHYSRNYYNLCYVFYGFYIIFYIVIFYFELWSFQYST